jgi:hypothetical protein
MRKRKEIEEKLNKDINDRQETKTALQQNILINAVILEVLLDIRDQLELIPKYK